MGIVVRSIIRTFVKPEMSQQALPKVEDTLNDIFGLDITDTLNVVPETNDPNLNPWIDFPIDIYSHIDTIDDVVDELAKIDGVTGVLAVDCESMYGNYTFTYSNNVTTELATIMIKNFVDSMKKNLDATVPTISD